MVALRESGFIRADVGLESVSEKVQKSIRKVLPHRKALKKLRLLAEQGIWTDANLLFGASPMAQHPVERGI